jgi:two-component system repressor protein LuxO
MSSRPSVLIVEDSMPQAKLFHHFLTGENLQTVHAATGLQARSAFEKRSPELVLLDLKLPDDDGLSILKWIRLNQFPCAVVVVTGHSSVDVAVEVIKEGADDFLEKPVTADRLRTTVKNLLEKQRLQHLVEDYQSAFEREAYQGFIGSSLPMQAVYRIIEAAAPSRASVFITGESGTGKEVCAAAIHARGNRSERPFIALNCAAIPRDLMESEIFGHIKGAFTGAATERKGAATLADGGTLFLDEIGEMDLDLQTKLLRFIQTGRFRKVGGTKEEQVDVRFVCATNRDPLDAVADGRLREDLYYRLHVVPIQLPPLRERGDDIVAIARHFLRTFAQEEGKPFHDLSPEVDFILRHYDWPGNVRQLQNVIRNIVVLHHAETVEKHHLPPPLDQVVASHPSIAAAPAPAAAPAAADAPHTPTVRPLAVVEKEVIEQAIALCDGNIPKAASLLEVSPSTIYRKKQLWDAG